MSFPGQQLDNLAKLVRGGSVVFFVGSGFSLDSEHTSARRLVGRVLARAVAAGAVLRDHDACSTILESLVTTFGLAGTPDEPARFVSVDNIDLLAPRYYEFNDWAIDALRRVAIALAGDGAPSAAKRKRLIAGISALENDLLGFLRDRAPLQPIEPKLLANLVPRRLAGKLLFLETVGFADEAIMAGRPQEPDLRELAASYGDGIRPRHRVIARLAAEGLAPLIVTTNFDLLLEGAMRLEGLDMMRPDRPGKRPGPDDLRPARYQQFTRIADSNDYFDRAAGYQSALLVKIHGCADTYRDRRDQPDQLRNYLDAVVFTYREIQNWRQDAWSRDMLRTLARTHTLAFCGYSGADQVIHDTLRTVYEEMAGRRDADAPKHTGSRAFFFGNAGRTEFHAMEILRAAQAAAGQDTQGIDQPNLIGVTFEPAGFPRYDDVLLWLYHLVARGQQQEALWTALGEVADDLLGHQADPDFHTAPVQDAFEELVTAEQAQWKAWEAGDAAGTRAALNRIVAWTDVFHAALRRERAVADARLSVRGKPLRLDETSRTRHYVPAADHPAWSAWAVVVELALRKLVAAARGVGSGWAAETRLVRVPPGSHALVEYVCDERSPAVRAVLVETPDPYRSPPRRRLHGSYADLRHWPVDRLLDDESGIDLLDWAGAPPATLPDRSAEAARLLGVRVPVGEPA